MADPQQFLSIFESRRDPRSVAEDLERLNPFGPSLRFEAHRRRLQEFVQSGRTFHSLSDDDRPLLRHAYSESHEALDTLDALIGLVPASVVDSEIRRLLGGEETPRAARHYIELPGSIEQADEIQCSDSLEYLIETPIEDLRTAGGTIAAECQSSQEGPRNIAFELWLATLLRRAQVQAVKAEPDWLIEASIGRVGLAAKRIQAMKAMRSRVTEAANQIAEQIGSTTCVAGIVAIDLTLALDLHRKHWAIRQSIEAKQLHLAMVSVMRKTRDTVMSALASRTGVVGILLHPKSLVFVRDTQTFTTVRPILFAETISRRHPYSNWLGSLAAAMR